MGAMKEDALPGVGKIDVIANVKEYSAEHGAQGDSFRN